MAQQRTHGRIIPLMIIRIVDRLAGRRRGQKAIIANRSDERALLERQKVALARTAGILSDAENPDWETPDKTSAWVRKLRAADQTATEEKLSSSHPAP